MASGLQRVQKRFNSFTCYDRFKAQELIHGIKMTPNSISQRMKLHQEMYAKKLQLLCECIYISEDPTIRRNKSWHCNDPNLMDSIVKKTKFRQGQLWYE